MSKRNKQTQPKPDIPEHKVFISFHDCDSDRKFKERFAKLLDGHIVDKSVKDEDIDDTNLPVSRVRQIIRDCFIADAAVTVVLIGCCTWQRKHVDWEIGSSLRKTKKNPRCGLVGILLKCHPQYGTSEIDPRLLPPKLAINLVGDEPYSKLYNWPKKQVTRRFRRWIDEANQRIDGASPTIGNDQFKRNRTTECSRGWKSGPKIPKTVDVF